MCGILGTYNKTGKEASARFKVQKLSHRGPDDSGARTAGKAWFGHCRLSVIDLSDQAAQPFFDEEGRMLVYNGEVYNFKQLREELKGVSFKSESDTEVVFHLLRKMGSDALQKLNGCFALAYYDPSEDHLLLARDRFGIKPLWIKENDEELVFASELKALGDPNNDKDINREVWADYLRYSFIPAPQTALSGYQKMLPGHLLEIRNGLSVSLKWYDSNSRAQEGKGDSQSLRTILENAVDRRLVADVPVGCFLSGGLDSSIVSVIAAQKQSGIQTFSIAVKDVPYLDESKFARIVSEKVGTTHHEIEVSEEELISHLDDMLACLDEPFADSSALAYYILSKKTAEHVKVVLSGDGADEVFAGYNRHRAFYRRTHPTALDWLAAIPGRIGMLGAGNRENEKDDLKRKLSKWSELWTLPPAQRYRYLTSFLSEKWVSELISHKNSNHFIPGQPRKMNDYLLLDQQFILPNDMLVKADLMSMANGLEVRTPFLDHTVVEFANSLQAKFKINRSKGKIILRETFRDVLPMEIMERPKKGFEIPIMKWMLGPLEEAVRGMLSSENIQKYKLVNVKPVEKLIHSFYKHPTSELAYALWSLYVMHRWLENRIQVDSMA